MSGDPSASGARVPGTGNAARRRPFRQLPLRVRLLLIAVEVTAVLLVAAELLRHGPELLEPRPWIVSGALLVAAALHAELSLGAERMRRRIADTRYIDLSSVWTFAAALLLPAVPAVATVVAVYLHLFLRVFRPAGTPLHRQLYSTSTVVLAVYLVVMLREYSGVGGDVGSVAGVVTLLCCLLVYTLTNTLLVVAVIRLSQPRSSFLAILAGGEIVLELATLSLGALVAVVIVPHYWLLVGLLVPSLLLLEQTTLLRQLEDKANTDAKTGLLNADAWRSRATRLLTAARRDRVAAGVLILDLDHFKDVNDRYGHLVGDAVLASMADVLTGEVRGTDVVGRFGGEEFVVAMGTMKQDPAAGATAVRETCERIRRRVESMSVEVPSLQGAVRIDRLSVSVGAAVQPGAGTELDRLLAAADEALYTAKRAGRNQVRVRDHGGGQAGPAR
ncbi:MULTISPECIES: GGDEF domain-containing protein [Pseudonocardia]|uniref:GGDEF domain-containing protein n=2 Tax=Pseudonocardia TaxID=1847 RepID=A0ABQ0RRS5_9PSEU|nr:MULTISPECIES: GGDEF domain-containing protein [Pseudonocardia]OSY43117.1 putative diguanylate cyclase AdrA [Pseudonocardia autotrophica]TDN71605.1 diguanylate cyclase (GGDEF)-like protein [Pseudonocardia autotrophica]BBG02292.1 GGDEF domain-containing protein [Pseudonocardia autotrophica]GEC23372.1 GGDEF domain-containing protein [Pseudonocardia saturnea]